MRSYCFYSLLLLLKISSTEEAPDLAKTHNILPELSDITFLVMVNNTYKWIPPFDNSSYQCATTVKTGPLSPNTHVNKTEITVLGNCDNGSLVFTMRSDDQGHPTVVPVFHSKNLEPVYPPTCTISWNYSYCLPTQNDAEHSLLPGCSTSTTGGPENIQTISYWFYILEWTPAARKMGDSTEQQGTSLKKVESMTFLVAVNQTDTNCLMTSKTPPLKPGVLHNKTQYIYVGKCDYGALDFNITTSTDMDGNSQSYVDLIFHSHDIEDAAPPMCKISWDYSYRVTSESNFQSSLLPGCYIADSREGFHMTYYWFYILDWVLS